ncbi:Gfo/Idh/MocA family oxidoreductase [Paenibacillus mesophilus]|nr:Gfo/Idh/MocA family oxidoreductase [Paenibacillus mesophilus]
MTRQQEPVTAVIVGAGHRALIYAGYAEQHPDELRIVGVADPDPLRREQTASRFRLPADRTFATVEELTAVPRFADAAINGTMDHLHVQTTIPLLRAGYDVLLEKPIGVSEAEVLDLQQTAQKYGRRVMICHVLRYAPFYAAIRRQVEEGAIGDIVNVQTVEAVSFHHMAMAYVRGKWGNSSRCGSTILMAKCCHDLDMMTWMLQGKKPVQVSSFGSLTRFRPDKAPEGAGTRCLVDCAIEASCEYSARRQYLEKGLWDFYIWENLHLGQAPAEEEKEDILRHRSPYGRCVWHCDNDAVDTQAVIVEFEDGSTATHNLVGATAKPCRTIHLTGTLGEIQGSMEDGSFTIRRPDLDAPRRYTEEKVAVDVKGEMHGGGDLRLVADFVRMLRGETLSLSTTSLEQSIYGHRIGFAADRSRIERRTVAIDVSAMAMAKGDSDQ